MIHGPTRCISCEQPLDSFENGFKATREVIRIHRELESERTLRQGLEKRVGELEAMNQHRIGQGIKLSDAEKKCSLLTQDLESVKREAKIFRDAAEKRVWELESLLRRFRATSPSKIPNSLWHDVNEALKETE